MLDGITDLHAWRPYPAAVMSRAVIEQCGYLLYESGKIADAWAGAKTSDVPDDLVMCGRYWVRTSPQRWLRLWVLLAIMPSD
jgi:hypothetical protein